MEIKICNKCGESKPIEMFYFRKDRQKYLSKCKRCSSTCLNTWRSKNPEKVEETKRRSWLKNTYGVAVEWYEGMLLEQGGVCAICQKADVYKGRTYLCIDHDHGTGDVRGLLCNDCNVGIARFGDNSDVLRRAAAYLEEHQ